MRSLLFLRLRYVTFDDIYVIVNAYFTESRDNEPWF